MRPERCKKQYWDKHLNKGFWCKGYVYILNGLKKCAVCETRRIQREHEKRFHPFKHNKNLIIDLTL